MRKSKSESNSIRDIRGEVWPYMRKSKSESNLAGILGEKFDSIWEKVNLSWSGKLILDTEGSISRHKWVIIQTRNSHIQS